MAETTGIEWADHTFNPWIGCTKVSPACDHCYAEDWARRHRPKAGLWQGSRQRTTPDYWKQPLKWNREAAAFRAAHGRAPMVFCASLADVFDNQVPDEWRRDLWALIEATPDLIWLLLTKRPQNIAKMVPWPIALCEPWPNVWFGTTVENQAEADRRIPHLLSVPAAKRFLSCEPLLGPVDLTLDGLVCLACPHCAEEGYTEWDTGAYVCGRCESTGKGDEWGIDWVISGGESGREARPSHPDWFRKLRDQCAAAGVPFLFKQWGEWSSAYDRDRDDPDWCACSEAIDARNSGRWLNFAGGHGFHGERVVAVSRVGKKAAGRALDGVIHDGRPVA